MKKISFGIALIFVTMHVMAQQVSAKLAITIDGIISLEEWSKAKRASLTGGGECLFLQDDQNLYVGVKGVGEGWSHVYVYNDQEILVMHASAALGQVHYRKDDAGSFQTSDEFSWAMRNPSLSNEAKEQRLAHLKDNGWVASTNSMGNKKEIEFVIGKGKLIKANTKIALVYASDAKHPQYWPDPLNDDCLKEDLIYGNAPKSLSFSPVSWGSADNP